jgi:hypothetical protein
LDHEALHVLNQLFREVHGRLDDLDKKTSPHQQLKTSGTLVFGTVPAQSAVEATLYVGNANTGGTVHVSPAQGVSLGNANLIWSAYVSHQNQVRVRLLNPTSSGVAVNTIKWNVLVTQ